MLLQFKIQLNYLTKPTVWRRVTVPDGFTFTKFHRVIQAAFGWEDAHLFQFSPKGWGSSPVIEIPTPDYDEGEAERLHATKTKLSGIFTKEGQKFVYIYDFGDDWQHSIILEEKLAEETKTATVVAGEGACPPEDCGGFPGYELLKQTLANPKHPEYEDMREWLGLEPGEKWDADAFDLAKAQKRVKAIR